MTASVVRNPAAHTSEPIGTVRTGAAGAGTAVFRGAGGPIVERIGGAACGADNAGTAMFHPGATDDRGTTAVAPSSVAARIQWRTAADRDAKIPTTAKPPIRTALVLTRTSIIVR